MIILKRPANVHGCIEPAGTAIHNLPYEQERLFVEAGNAEWPGAESEAEVEAEAEAETETGNDASVTAAKLGRPSKGK